MWLCVVFQSHTEQAREQKKRGSVAQMFVAPYYRIMDLKSRKVLTVRHVSFDENIFPGQRWMKHKSEADVDKMEEENESIYVMEQNDSDVYQGES